MKTSMRFALTAAAFLLTIALTANNAHAALITLSTSGCFGAGCTPATVATVFSADATLVFFSQSPTVIDTSLPGLTDADLGTFTLSGAGTFSSTAFTLRLIQTAPSFGSDDFVGSVTGTVVAGGAGSDARIVFNNTTLAIGAFTYTLANLTSGNTLPLNPGGVTTISALISEPSTSVPVPEPASMLLLGVGLTAAAVRSRRKRQSER